MTAKGSRPLSPKALDAMSATLYASPGPLVSGMAVLCTVSALVAHRTGDMVPLLGCIALLALGLARVALLVSYLRSAPSSRRGASMADWRRRYAAGILATSTTVGLLTAASLVLDDDTVCHLVLVASAVGYASGVAGRNAACLEVSLPQLWAALLPTAAGLFVHGGLEYATLGAVVLVFAVGMTQIGLSIHRALADAYLSGQEREDLADRFDAALDSMQQGFCLFGKDGRLVAASRSTAILLGTPMPPTGVHAAALADSCAAAGTLTAGASPGPLPLAEMVSSPFPSRREIALSDGRTLSLAASPKADGGCVILLDDVTDRVDSARDLLRMASHDTLTGLLNRRAASAVIEPGLARGESVAVLLIDLDRFKGVNDAFGHAIGDGLLRAVAERIRSRIPAGAAAARLGGDEFLVLLPVGCGDPLALARDLSVLIGQPYTVEGRELSVGASVGLAVSPRDGSTPDALMRNADTALYRVKTSGRQGWRAFDPRMDEAVLERRAMESDLREALARNDFHVAYQPQMHLASGRTVAFEALVRWTHPARGHVSPSDFIPVAEETGLIHGIGRLVLEEACREALGWDESVTVAVNISPAQFRQDLPAMVGEVLCQTGLPPRRLELEVTESVFLESHEEVLSAFRRLKDMGVNIALDDFGSGYSSLGYLRAFPFRKVKVDRAFVNGIEGRGEGRAVVRAVVGLGRDLGMGVVVEGVETQAQLDTLRELACDTVQGYLLSRPLTASQALAWAREGAAPVLAPAA